MATEQAQRWLWEYFGAAGGWYGALPEPVAAWLRRHQARSDTDDDVPAPTEALVVRHPAAGGRPARQLRLRLSANPSRDGRVALLSEESDPLSALLSPRESEVLRQAALGHTDAEIADDLFISRRTVNGHLQQIYRKLGVAHRSAAIARFFQAPPPI